MNRNTLGGLIVLNVTLLGALILFSFITPDASGQFSSPRMGDYVMVGSITPGQRDHNTIFITDLNNNAILAVFYNESRKQLIPVGFRDISGDSEARTER